MSDEFLEQTLAGKYRIEEFWHEDTVSKTYHAVQTSIDKPVTIKILGSDLAGNSAVAESLETEARILSRIANPHILNVLDVAKAESGAPFLVLEADSGRSLRELIKNEGGLSLERAVVIARQIAEVLTVAHSNNIFHGNLSTDDILLAERNGADFVKVLNFGALNEIRFDAEKTVVRPRLPFYQAPEQLSSDAQTDARTDIYALGVLLFEILTGRPPFVDEDAATLAQKHLREIPPSLIAARPDLPPSLEQVVQRALAKQPGQRFQSAAEFSEALSQSVKTGLIGSTPYAGNFAAVDARQVPLVGQQNGANNPYKTAFIVLIGIVALSVFGIYSTGGFRNTPTVQVNSDPNALPVQPLNPASSNGEDLSDLGLQPVSNNNLPTIVTPGSGASPGGIAPPMGGSIPPGLYPGGGQTVVVPGNSNSIFMSDLNSNAGYPVNGNRNANVAANANVKPPAANANAAPSPRPANSNTGGSSGNINSAPTPSAPTPTPIPKPTPRPPPKSPSPAPAKPSTGTESLSQSAPSGAN